jgi:glycyl-tRNA synthetase beta chain
MKDLLLEIGCENLPPAAIRPAFEQLGAEAAKKLGELRLSHEKVYATGSPRRLVLIVRGLAAAQSEKTEVVTGPPVSKAYDENGAPTATAAGFARSHGVDAASLERVRTARGEYVGFSKQLTCGKTPALLKDALGALVAGIKFPKTMKWERSLVRFARPIRWIVCLYGDAVVPFEIAGVKSGRVTAYQPWLDGRRYEVKDADHYLATLRRAGIIVDHEERRAAIEALARKTAAGRSLEAIEDPDLVDELAFMLESPRILTGEFDKSYLALPPEVVTTAMKAHQRYIALRAKGKKLVPFFLTFTEGKRSSPALVRAGNERVLRARLEDALFYWKEDLAAGIEGLSRRLSSIVFMEGLGSLSDKAERLHALARTAQAAWPEEDRIPDGTVRRAALFVKADLASEMVKDGKEFTLLEGLIGSHYASEAKEPAEIVSAIREHYLPRSPSEALPKTRLGTILGIADRVDTLAGCFLAGLIPTGSQDPYALRRQAMGLVRMLEHHPEISITPLVRAAVEGYVSAGLGGKRDSREVAAEVEDFIRIRTETFLKDKGIAPDAVAAVGAVVWQTPGVALRRAKAIERLRGDRAFELLITGAKRVGNILGRESKTFGSSWETIENTWLRGGAAGDAAPFDPARFEDDEERALHAAIREALPRIRTAESESDYASVFAALAKLGPVIDRYFDHVLVNTPDPLVRTNRHRFLAAVFSLFSKYADFSLIVEQGKTPDPGGTPRS